jgi:bifunctional non-homologous end joining protein LigD
LKAYEAKRWPEREGAGRQGRLEWFRRLTPTPVSGDGPELYNKRGFGPHQNGLQGLARDPAPAYLLFVPRIAFLPIASPKLRPVPPSGPEWLHEVKHDGWRAQLHRSSAGAVILSKNGKDISGRFAPIRAALRNLPACIIDAEVVGCDADGMPDFRGLMAGNSAGFCAWCFDLLAIDGRDVRKEPLEQRRERLRQLLSGADQDLLRYSDAFDDGEKLLEAAVRFGLEGIVSKKRSAPYVSGSNSGWIKVKTATWREANSERYKLFEKA